ncbi:MAG: hypothetical protein K1X47_16010 [Cyclobacteriaceae bacterium]|nr:hypothetical protein [Cyclobacteriaceae bacterium]
MDPDTLANEHTIYVGFAIAAVVFFIYAWNHGSGIAFLNVAGIVLASQAAVGGGALCLKALSTGWCPLSQSERVYIFLGGLAVVWNAFVSIKRLGSKPTVA